MGHCRPFPANGARWITEKVPVTPIDFIRKCPMSYLEDLVQGIDREGVGRAGGPRGARLPKSTGTACRL